MMQKVLIFLVILCSAFSAVVFSAEENAEHGAAAEHHMSWFQVISQWFNFLVLAYLLYYFLKKTMKVPDRFKEDYDVIQKSVESARQAKEEAERKLQELDTKMAALHADIARLKEEAAKEADEERKQILQAAHKEAERIVELANREVEAEVDLARRMLRKNVADIAILQGREIIQKEINEQDQKKLIEDYIKGLKQ